MRETFPGFQSINPVNNKLSQISQINPGHVRPEVAHLLGDDLERQPVLGVPGEFRIRWATVAPARRRASSSATRRSSFDRRCPMCVPPERKGACGETVVLWSYVRRAFQTSSRATRAGTLDAVATTTSMALAPLPTNSPAGCPRVDCGVHRRGIRSVRKSVFAVTGGRYASPAESGSSTTRSPWAVLASAFTRR